MFDFEKPKIEIKEMSEDNRYGKFVVEPLERGYGITLGNSLRRIMLSSLPGAAVSQIKIEGVLHEFSSIPGVKEDVTEIVMNVKSLEIKNNSETNEPKIAYIEHEAELADYRAAKATMAELLGGEKLPKMDVLKEKRRQLAARKKALYLEYRKAQQDMRELVAVKGSVDHLRGLTDNQRNKEQAR